MRIIKTISIGLLIYVAIPASLLYIVFQLTDKHSEALEKGVAVIFDQIDPEFAYNISRLFKFKEDEDDEIPLIKAMAKADNDVIISENFIKKDGAAHEMTPPSLQEEDISDIALNFEDQTFSSEDIIAD